MVLDQIENKKRQSTCPGQKTSRKIVEGNEEKKILAILCNQ